MRKHQSTAAILLFGLALLLSACGGHPAETSGETDGTTAPAAEQTTEVGTAAPTEPAEEKSPLEQERDRLSALTVAEMDDATFAKIIYENAMAYYNKRKNVQYDLGVVTLENKPACGSRRTTGQTPEETDWDSMLYAQCSEFVYDLYLQAFDYEWINLYSEAAIYEKNNLPTIVTSYDRVRGLSDIREAADILVKEAKAGDVFYGWGSASGSGHVILILGDIYGDGVTYCMHCWPLGGGSLNDDQSWRSTKGDQYFEPEGALVIQTMDELLIKGNGNPAWGVFTGKNDGKWFLFRPSLEEGLRAKTMTPAAVSRYLYGGLDVSKSLKSLNTFSDITEGQVIVVNEVLTNTGKEDYKDLTVTEYVPEGAVLKGTPKDAVVDGNKLTWTVSLAAGKSKTLSYTVVNQKKFGETLVFEAGSADHIPTRTFSLPVAGDGFSASQLAALKTVAEQGTPTALEFKDYQDLAFVNAFYDTVLGVRTELPATVNELLDALFIREKTLFSDGVKMLQLTEENNEALRRMLIKKHTAGFYVSTGTDKSVRLMDTQAEYYKPGDVFIYFYGSGNNYRVEYPENAVIDICLDGDRYFEYTVSGGKIVSFDESVGKILKSSVILALRPEQAIEKTAKDVQMPEFADLVLTSLQELQDFSQSAASKAVLEGKIALEGLTFLENKSLRLAAGSALELGDFDLELGQLTLEEGAELTAGTGRVNLAATSGSALEKMLESFAGLPVEIKCAYDTVENVYDCAEKTAYYDSVAATVGTANMTDLFLRVPSGWTVCLLNGLCSGVELEVAHEDVTVDLNGKRIGFFVYKGCPLTVTDRAGGGIFYIRGDQTGTPRTQSVDINAPGIPVVVGFHSDSEKADLYCKLTLDAKLTCASLRLDFGSTLELGPKGEVAEK